MTKHEIEILNVMRSRGKTAIVILPTPVFSDRGRIKSGHTICLWLEMFEISPVSFQKHPQNGNKQKITVVEIVSTTVTDLAYLPLVDTMHHVLKTWCIILWVRF